MTQSKAHQIVAEARRSKEEREKGYREQALKLFPWICGRCTREFDHKNLRELTVHHTNHNHDDNPADGSNWELLCVYCHDNEHQRFEEQSRFGSKGSSSDGKTPVATFSPFADLKKMMQKD